MIIRGRVPNYSFTMVDRHVFTVRGLSDGAKVLYGYLAGLKNGANFSDTYILKALDTSQTVLTRRKKELKDHGLILVDQISPRVYVLYVGNTKESAEHVKLTWITEEDKT